MSPFKNSGLMIDRKYYTQEVVSNYQLKKQIVLQDILEPEKDVDKQYYVKKEFVLDDKKGGHIINQVKKIERIDKETGLKYTYMLKAE